MTATNESNGSVNDELCTECGQAVDAPCTLHMGRNFKAHGPVSVTMSVCAHVHPFKPAAKEGLGVGEYVRGGMLHPEHWTEMRGVNEDELERRFEIAAAGISPMQRPFARMWFESGFIEGAGWARPQMTAEGRRDFNEHYARTEGKL